VLVVRNEASLLYFNVEHVRDRIVELLADRRDPVSVVVLFLGAVPGVDLAGADMLAELRHALLGRHIDLRLAGAHGRVRDALTRAGYDASAVHAFRSVASALP
jgi:MFS superfamily sulfate permease-like transporter